MRKNRTEENSSPPPTNPGSMEAAAAAVETAKKYGWPPLPDGYLPQVLAMARPKSASECEALEKFSRREYGWALAYSGKPPSPGEVVKKWKKVSRPNFGFSSGSETGRMEMRMDKPPFEERIPRGRASEIRDVPKKLTLADRVRQKSTRAFIRNTEAKGKTDA